MADILFWPQVINSIAPGRSEYDSKNVIFNLVLLIGIFSSSHDNALQWMPQDLTDDKSTLVQVMAWCRQATRNYLSQCWLSSLLPYGVARPQWVNSTTPSDALWCNKTWSTLVQVMACLLPDGSKSSSEPMLIYHQWGPLVFISMPFHSKCQRCQHSIFKMLNDFQTYSKKCLIYDELVKNFPIFLLNFHNFLSLY